MNMYRHIICATDLSENSQYVCARAAALSGCFDSRLTLLHVVEYFPEDKSNEFIEPEDVDPRQYREDQALKILQKLASSIGCSGASRVVLFSTHSGWHEVARFALDKQADLIVLTERENRGLTAFAPRSLSRQRAYDVLTVHVPAKNSAQKQNKNEIVAR
jgi:universal stress protein A